MFTVAKMKKILRNSQTDGSRPLAHKKSVKIQVNRQWRRQTPLNILGPKSRRKWAEKEH